MQLLETLETKQLSVELLFEPPLLSAAGHPLGTLVKANVSFRSLIDTFLHIAVKPSFLILTSQFFQNQPPYRDQQWTRWGFPKLCCRSWTPFRFCAKSFWKRESPPTLFHIHLCSRKSVL